MKPFLIVAHRGGKGPYKENTLLALQHGLEQGAKALEMDVRFDYWRQHFYLEHDFFHLPKGSSHFIDNVLPDLPVETPLVIDLKTLDFRKSVFALHFYHVLQKHDLFRRAILESFNPFTLIHLRRLNAELQIGFLIANEIWAQAFMQWIYRDLKPQYMMLHRRFLGKEKLLKECLAFAHKHGLRLLFFTVNEEEELKKVYDLGAYGVITDYPEKARKVVG